MSVGLPFDLGETGCVHDERNGPERISAEVRVAVVDVLEEGTGDDVDGGVLAHLLYVYIDCPPQGSIFRLEKFSNGEEELRAFIIRKGLALV